MQGIAGPRIALVLSGGGARGLAQIGVLRELERNNIRPDIIIGTSIGAIIGGMYCAGFSPDDLDSIFTNIDWEHIMALADASHREHLSYRQKLDDDRSLLTLRFRNFSLVVPTAVSGSARFATLLQDLLWQSPFNTVTNFDSLRIPFRAIATDLGTGTWVALDSGNLATALRASASFPLRYAPYRDSSRMLVDGGLVANIPIEPAMAMGCETIIVVNTVADLLPVAELVTPWAVADQALSSAMKQRDAAFLQRATIVIDPDLRTHATFDFSGLDSVIRKGEEGARQAMTRIKELAQQRPPTPTTNGARIRSVVVHGTAALNEQHTGYVDLPLDASAVNISRIAEAVIARMHDVDLDFAYVRRTQFEHETGTLHVYVDEGRVASIEIDKQRSVRTSAITHELTFDVGDLLTRERVARAAANLRASDVLDDVDVTVSPAPQGGCRVIIGAVDRGDQLLRAGLRIDNERNAQGGLQATQIDALSTGVNVDVRVMGAVRIGTIDATLEVPRILGSFWTARATAYTSFRHVYIYSNSTGRGRTEPERFRSGEFSEDRNGLRLSFGRQIERQGVILGEFRYEQQRYRDRQSAPVPLFQPLATFKGVGRWDDRDSRDFASRGRAIDVSLESSILNLSNGLSFTKLMLSYRSAHAITPTITLLPNFLVGAADRTLPSPELFSMGGQDNFFGMREDEERGRQIVVGQLDVRWKAPFRIFFDTYFSLRYDLGAVWANPENIRFGELRHGVGATAGLDTPVGPALISVGRRFYFLSNPDGVAVGPLLAYFSIGLRL